MPLATLPRHETHANRRLPPSSRQLPAVFACCFGLTVAATDVAAAGPEQGGAPAAKANEQTVALNACVDAFVRANQLTRRPVVLRTKPSSLPPVRMGLNYLIELNAVASRSRQWLGGSRCVVQPNGTVVTLNGRPVEASDAGTRLADR